MSDKKPFIKAEIKLLINALQLFSNMLVEELFDYIAETGKFSEKVSRTYFHQLMNGLHHMHKKGYAHRDIKP
jgi:serine/threonine protein kinase